MRKRALKGITIVSLMVLVVLGNLLAGFAEQSCSWEQKANFNIGRRYFASAEVNGKIYIIGGDSPENGWLSSVEEYDPATNTCVNKASLKQARSFISAATYDNKIYVFGGSGGRNITLDTVEMYNPATNTWVSKANMPIKRSGHKAITVNNKIYIFGGIEKAKQIDVYDPITNTWETKGDMPFDDRSGYSLSTAGSKIYFISGRKSQKFDKSVDIYDTISNKWETASNLIYDTTDNSSITYKNNIYTIVNETRTTTNILATFNIENNIWSYSSLTPFYSATAYEELQIIDNKLYIIGGQINDSEGGFINASSRVVSIDLSKLSTASPTNLTATPANAQVTLNWTAVDGAESYNVKRSTTQGGPYTTIADNVTGTSYIDTNVTNGTTYYYVVTAVNADGESENSNEASATPFAPIVNRALLNITMQNSLIKEYDMAMTEVESFISWYNRSSGSKLYTINKYNNIGPFLNRKDYLVKDKILCFEVMEYDNNN